MSVHNYQNSGQRPREEHPSHYYMPQNQNTLSSQTAGSNHDLTSFNMTSGQYQIVSPQPKGSLNQIDFTHQFQRQEDLQYSMPLQQQPYSLGQSAASNKRGFVDLPIQVEQDTDLADQSINMVYSGMKLLENKYIDLANFYKEQLVADQNITRKLLRKSGDNQPILHALDRQQTLRKQETAVKENAIIRSLVEVKSELEQQIMDLRTAVMNHEFVRAPELNKDLSVSTLATKHQTSCDRKGDQQPIYSDATHLFLQDTLHEMLTELDKAQVQSLHVLSTKQYDMFDMATKNKIPSALRNDYLGHWYDAKTTVSQHFADLKTALTLRQQMADVQFKLQEGGVPVRANPLAHKTIGSPLRVDHTKDLQRQLDTVLAEFTRHKQVAEPQTKKLKTVMMALKVKDQVFREERQKQKASLEELARSIDDQIKIVDGRLRIQQATSPLDKPRRSMSPFEQRLKTYQQNALQRQTPKNMNRSNSRGKRLSRDGTEKSLNSATQLRRSATKQNGIGFYADHDASAGKAHKTDDLKVIKTKLTQLLTAYEATAMASRQKDRYENELLKQLDLHLAEQLIYIGQGSSLMENKTVQGNQNALEELRDMVNQERSMYSDGLTSPVMGAESYNNQNLQKHRFNSKFGSQEPRQEEELQLGAQEDQSAENQSNQSMAQVNKVRSQKVQELQDSNDQLFSELRKANEKYLDVRVENNKLKDQIQNLKLSVDQLKLNASTAQSRQRALSSSGGGAYTGARKKTTADATQVQADAELRKQHDILKTDTQQVCNLVKSFMAAMRALQKAVSRKEPDMSEQKKSFDTAKRELEDSVVTTLTKIQKEMPDVGTSQRPQMIQSAKTKSVSTMRVQQTATTLSQSRDISGQRGGHGTTMRPTSMTGYNNLSSKRSGASRTNRADDELNLNLLQKQVKGLQLEKDKMRELIEELKQTSSLFQNERDLVEEKLKTKTAQLHRFASQCQANSHKVMMLEQMLSDYKYTIIDLGSNAQVQQVMEEAGSETVKQMHTKLLAKEDELKAKLDQEVNRIFVNLKIDPQFVALKEELTSQVKLKEKLLDQQFDQLTFRVAEKEEDLQRLKLLFVEKLRELETSFVEISHEVDETDKVAQDVTAKRKQEIQSLLGQKPMNGQNSLDRSMEAILSNYDNDEKQRQMEELIQANHDLMEQNEKLKDQLASKEAEAQNSGQDMPGLSGMNQAASDNLHAEMVIELNEQIDEAKQECEKLKRQLKLATHSEGLVKKEIQGLKYDNKRMNMDLKDAKERYEKVKMEYHQQFQSLKTNTVAMQQKLQKEYDARTTSETKYLAVQKQLKIARQENSEQQTEMLLLIKRLEDMHAEQTILKELRGDDEDSTDDEIDDLDAQDANKAADEDDKEEDQETQAEIKARRKKEKAEKRELEEAKELEDRIAEDPQEAARFYHRVFTVTKQEFKSMSSKHSKLIKLDSEQQNLNSKLQDLEQEKEDLIKQVSKGKRGTQLVVCMQNFVRQMLQDKLEESAKQLESMGQLSKKAQDEAESLREKASQLEKDHQDALTSQASKIADLERQIEETKQRLGENEESKQDTLEQAQKIKEQQDKIGDSLDAPDKSNSEEELRSKITEELEQKYHAQQQEMIKTYKRTQQDINEKHQAALLALETQLADSKAAGSNDDQAAVAEVRLALQADHDAAIKKMEEESQSQLSKAHKQTRLLICLQNRVREMVAAKLEEAQKEHLSLKADLKDVTESHNLKIKQMQAEKEEETAALIKKNEELIKEMETKIRKEVAESASQDGQDKMQELIQKLESDHGSVLEEEKGKLEALRKTHDEELEKSKKATKLVISMQNFVREMLKERLEKREQELQLEIIQIRGESDKYCEELKSKQDEFEKYCKEKDAEFDEINSYKDDSAKKSEQIDAADAQIQSLKAVKEALEREKDDLMIQNENLEEELHNAKTSLLEIKGSLELKEIRIEELEEQLTDMQMATGLNRTDELDMGMGSSGKVIHQGDDLRSLEMNSEGMMEAGNNSFQSEGEESKSAQGEGRKSELARSKASLQRECDELRDQVSKLKQDLDANVASVGGGRTSWDGSMGRGSWGSDQMKTRGKEIEDHLKHVRSIMTQFLSKLPVTTKENEDILPVVFSMLNFSKDEIEEITEARTQLTDKAGKKGGMFGGLMGKKK